jgi:hypothetical protein
MKRRTFHLTFIAVTTLSLGACGGSSGDQEKKQDQSEQDSTEEDTVSRIVSATCSDLRNAMTQAEAAQTLSYAMQLANSVGVSDTQLGSLLSAACIDAINRGNTLP